MENTLADTGHLFNNEHARQGFQSFKKIKISGGCDATVSNIICLDAVSMETVEMLKRCLVRKDQDSTEKTSWQILILF